MTFIAALESSLKKIYIPKNTYKLRRLSQLDDVINLVDALRRLGCCGAFEIAETPLEDRKYLPETTGLYVAADSVGRVLYIGRAKNFRARWRCHHKIHELKNLPSVKIVTLSLPTITLEKLINLETLVLRASVTALNNKTEITANTRRYRVSRTYATNLCYLKVRTKRKPAKLVAAPKGLPTQKCKLSLEEKYGIDITEELIQLDNAGWYAVLWREYAILRNPIGITVANSALLPEISALARMGVKDFLNGYYYPNVDAIKNGETINIENCFNPKDCDLLDTFLERNKQPINANYIKSMLGVNITEKTSATNLLGRVLAKLGFCLVVSHRTRKGRYYSITRKVGKIETSEQQLIELSEEVFQAWNAQALASTTTTHSKASSPNPSR